MIAIKGKPSISIKGLTIDGAKAQQCPKCDCVLLPSSFYNVPEKTSTETARCLNCGYVECAMTGEGEL